MPTAQPLNTHFAPLAPIPVPTQAPPSIIQYPHFLSGSNPNFPNLGNYPNLGWGGVNIPHLTAVQAQSMTRGQRQEEVRLEINKLLEQINAANNQIPGQGTFDLPALVQKEAELTRSLTQTYL